MPQHDVISVIYGEDPRHHTSPDHGHRSLLPKVGEVDTETLSRSLRKLTGQMNELFDELTGSDGPFELSSFDVAVEVTGTGEVRLIGSVSLAVTGGITLSFTRRSPAAR